MNDGTLYKRALALLMVALLVGVSLVQESLNRERERLQLTRVVVAENMPPLLAFTTVALGGFRGLIANVLWARANDLQQDEKFFEMVQLADWITKLQPHIPMVWVHQGWNMAYNISVKFPAPEDRWFWVRSGIELLRDQGLKYNPNETLIYRELAWFFQHKMGGNLDAAHMVYKQQWSEEMADVFGSHRPVWEELLNPQTDDARARVRLLREKYKMDPVKMKKVDDRYGPLEWRLPETHAIYWASLGLERCPKKDEITLRRVIFQSMQLAAVRGRLIENRPMQQYEFGPNLDVFPKANQAYEEMMAEDKSSSDMIVQGHRNFLKQMIGDLYIHNRVADAARWYKYSREKYPDYFTIPDMNTFALERYKEVIETGGKDKVQDAVEGLFRQSFYYEAIDESEQAVGYARLAQHVYVRYQERTSRAETNRVDLPPIRDLQEDVLRRVVGPPPQGFPPPLQLQLLTARGMPMPTNAWWLQSPVPPPIAPTNTGRPTAPTASNAPLKSKTAPASPPKGPG
jgi:hypothetical protein